MKIYSTLVVAVVFVGIFLLSFIVHVSVHWLQFSISRDLKPVGIALLPAGSNLVNGDYREFLPLGAPAVVVAPRYDMTAEQFFALLNSQRPALELQALLVQLLSVALSSAAALELGTRRGWIDA